VLAGEIDYRRGDLDAAFAQLRSAVELDARLNYDEPWGWMEPARHALGALLVEQGRHAEAERVYREDLARFPENGWSLHGLAECLRATGRAAEADDVERRLRRAWQWADTALVGSCFCRTK
jgi:tetratricopeptide (TPR) repeat protein